MICFAGKRPPPSFVSAELTFSPTSHVLRYSFAKFLISRSLGCLFFRGKRRCDLAWRPQTLARTSCPSMRGKAGSQESAQTQPMRIDFKTSLRTFKTQLPFRDVREDAEMENPQTDRRFLLVLLSRGPRTAECWPPANAKLTWNFPKRNEILPAMKCPPQKIEVSHRHDGKTAHTATSQRSLRGVGGLVIVLKTILKAGEWCTSLGTRGRETV